MSFDVRMANGQHANRRIHCEPERVAKVKANIRRQYGEIETQVVPWSTLLVSVYFYVPDSGALVPVEVKP